MTPEDLKGMDVLVVGLGRSGQSATRLLLKAGARVTATDRAPAAALTGLDGLKNAGVRLELGNDYLSAAHRDLVVVSPGVPLSHPELSAARLAGVRVVAEVELASWFLPQPLVGITGTNGKSTTTALCGEMLRAAGLATFVGGNLGTPLSEAVGGHFEVLVVELSSFQLEGIETLRPRAAALLNLSPDHLDRYPTFEAYQQAKARLFQNQGSDDLAVYNADDPACVRLASQSRGRRLGFGSVGTRELGAQPVAEGFELEVNEGAPEGYSVRSRALRGSHNVANAMAAALCARSQGVSPAAIQAGIDRFPGLPHRMEWVRELAGVEYVNDSKATNVASAAIALRALPGWLCWIAGGRGKGAPYSPLRSLLEGRLRCLLTIGEDAPALAEQLTGIGPIESCGDLPRAVRRAAERAQSGDIVLLSPACASYDQFHNFEERGDAFRSLVRSL
jgi:UDP-N-acetylmuramoylalanine--D-glutamate ligase